jgi:hypothetical protein
VLRLNETPNSNSRNRIFILEGLITIFISSLVFVFMPNFPAKDKWLKESDQTAFVQRLEADKGKENGELANISWTKVFLEYKVWLL